MKTKLIIISLVAIVVGACTTGTRLTKTYEDDIYFSPADVPPVAVAAEQAQADARSAKSGNNNTKEKKIIMSQIERDANGAATVNNYIYQQDKNNSNLDDQSYNMNNQELVDSDTTRYYNDDDVKTVINNYYDDNDVDYAYRIGRFYNPYNFSPYYNDWYNGYYSPWYSGYSGLGWNYGWGYDPYYSWGWGYPYSYGYYSPFAFGLGYYGLGGWYGGWYGGGYYNDYGWGGGNYYRNHDVARRRDTNLSLPGGVGRNYNGSISGISSGRRPNTVVDGTSDLKNATLVNERRGSTSTNGRRISNTPGREISTQMQQNAASGSIRRAYEPSTTGRTYDQSGAVRQNYTPSYNKPRIVNQSNYNSNNYSRPRTSSTYDRSAVRSSSSGGVQYTEPRSSSSMRQTYRSSSSYSTGSSSSGYNRSGSSSGYNRSSSNYNSSPSYSAPSRSSSSYSGGSSGSYSGGSSGSSSGGSSGGGGGSGHRR